MRWQEKNIQAHEDTEGVGGPLLHAISPLCHHMWQSDTRPLATPVVHSC